MKQPLLGIIATAGIIVLSWLVIWAMSTDFFMGWASYVLMCAIPFAIVVGAFWQSSQPPGIARLPQPGKGVAYLVGTALIAAVVAVIHWQLRSGGMGEIAPTAVMTIITSVVTMFFLAIAFGGWPFSRLDNKVLGGMMLLVSAYVLNAVIFLLMDFGFLMGTPLEPLASGGLFDAWDVVVVMVTSLAVMFLFLCFDVWPLTTIKALRSQPLLGLGWTAACFVIGLVVFWLGTSMAGIPGPTFMVTVSIPFLFGAIIMVQMLGGSVFGTVKQPVKGLATAIGAAVIGLALAALYRVMMPILTEALPGGPANNFTAELWVANSLLAVTFPFLAFFGDFFGLWPLAGKEKPVVGEAADITT